MRTVTALALVLSVVHPFVSQAVSRATPQPRDTWRELAPLELGRAGCKAHALDGRRAIVVAGWGDTTEVDASVELYDAATDRWTRGADMPDGFAPGAIPWTAALDDGYVLVVGGFNAFLQTGDLRSFLYDSRGDRWIATGQLPPTATLASNFGQTDMIVLDDGRALAASGLELGVGESRTSMVFVPDYDALEGGLTGEAAGRWQLTGPLHGGSEHHKLCALGDGRVLLVHGNDRAFFGTPWGDVYRDTHGVQAELFDPETDTWAIVGDLPAIPGEDDHDGTRGVRQQATCETLLDGRVLVAGGTTSPADEDGVPVLDEVYRVRRSVVAFDPDRFDAGEDPWSIVGAMRVEREAARIGRLPGGDVLVVGGWTQSAWTRSAERFDPATDAWHAAGALPGFDDLAVSLPYACSAMLPGGRMLLTGGAWDLEREETSRRAYVYRP